jgi:hypothetical protein
MTRLFDHRRLTGMLAAAAGGVLLASGAATTASAAGTTDPAISHSGQSRYCTDFVNHLSRSLDVSNDRLRAAIVQSARDTIDDAVARGDLTKSQADSLKKRFTNNSMCPATATASHVGRVGGQAH